LFKAIKNRFIDYFRFIEVLTPQRVVNATKVYLGYLLSLLSTRAIVWGKPYSMSLEPTNYCNLRCPECPSGNNSLNRAKGFMEVGLFRKIIDQTAGHLTWLMLYFQGEPFLHKELFEMVRYADNKNIYTCISTNGHFLTPQNCKKIIESGLDRIIVSIDGADKETYKKYRVKGDLQIVKEGINRLAEEKKKRQAKAPYIVVQCLAFKHNQHQLKEIKTISRKLGADKTDIKTAQLYNYAEKKRLIPDDPHLSRYEKTADDRLIIKNKLKNKCFRIWNSCVIGFDGQMLPCCFDKKTEHPMGDLKDNSFKECWKSINFNGFRKKILVNRKGIAICRNCI
jgi:radical SAM protein with 4Fe4S-binding SPASM domain